MAMTDEDAGPTETTALLESAPSAVQTQTQPQPTPLPKLQIFLLSFTRVAEPLCFAILFPFVNAMVLSTGETSVEEVGYYVGAIESMFSLTQMIFLIPWGYAADRFGRKPVLLVSLLGAALSTTLFGFSTKIWQMIAARCIGGLFGGNAVVVRTLFAEFSDSSNQARAFSFFAFASNVGLFIGPVIGGALSQPGIQFPNTLGRIPLFRAYPYALPCLISGVYVIIAFVLDLFLLREPARRTQTPSEAARAKPGLRSMLTGPVLRAFTVFGMAMLLGLGYTAILPVYLFTPIELGGLAFPPPYIAATIATAGFSQSIWLLFAMPPLDRRLGTYRLTRICFSIWPWFFFLPIGANLAAKHGFWWAPYVLMGFSSTIVTGVAIAFTTVQLMINNVSPPSHLGAINGFALTLNSAIRTVAPAAFTSLFALGVERNIFERYLAWIVLWLTGLLGFALSGLAPRDSVREAGVGERGDGEQGARDE